MTKIGKPHFFYSFWSDLASKIPSQAQFIFIIFTVHKNFFVRLSLSLPRNCVSHAKTQMRPIIGAKTKYQQKQNTVYVTVEFLPSIFSRDRMTFFIDEQIAKTLYPLLIEPLPMRS